MITRNNVKEIFNSLKAAEIQTEIDKAGDYLIIWLHIFNAGSYATIESRYYNEEEETDAADNGQLFIDKDNFLQMYEETTGKIVN